MFENKEGEQDLGMRDMTKVYIKETQSSTSVLHVLSLWFNRFMGK